VRFVEEIAPVSSALPVTTIIAVPATPAIGMRWLPSNSNNILLINKTLK
jgi:hypothetical protein